MAFLRAHRRLLLIALAVLTVTAASVLLLVRDQNGLKENDPNRAGSSGNRGTGVTKGTSGDGTSSGTSDGSSVGGKDSHASPIPSPTSSLPPNLLTFGIAIEPSSDPPRPSGCSLQAGQSCRVEFDGRYRLTDFDNAIIRVGAFEDGSDTASFSSDLPVFRGGQGWYVKLYYKPRPNVQKVTFRAFLIAPDGTTLSAPESHFTFQIT